MLIQYKLQGEPGSSTEILFPDSQSLHKLGRALIRQSRKKESSEETIDIAQGAKGSEHDTEHSAAVKPLGTAKGLDRPMLQEQSRNRVPRVPSPFPTETPHSSSPGPVRAIKIERDSFKWSAQIRGKLCFIDDVTKQLTNIDKIKRLEGGFGIIRQGTLHGERVAIKEIKQSSRLRFDYLDDKTVMKTSRVSS